MPDIVQRNWQVEQSRYAEVMNPKACMGVHNRDKLFQYQISEKNPGINNRDALPFRMDNYRIQIHFVNLGTICQQC